MPVASQVEIEEKTFSGWAAKWPEAEDYLRDVELAPCASAEPESCLLRETRELSWGEDPQAAIRALVGEEEPGSWPETTALRPFDYQGPVAQINDVAAETELLSSEVASSIWDDLRGLAGDRRLGVIELNQLKRLMVPVFALRESGASFAWAPARESVLKTALALPLRPEVGHEDSEEDWM
jgi:hypothetical protein